MTDISATVEFDEDPVSLLLRTLEDAYSKPAWHGPNLRGSLRQVRVERAAWRPAEGHTNVWEITVHCAYWKYAVWRWLTGAKRGSFAYKGSNWFVRPQAAPSEREWRQDVALLDEMHRKLVEAISALRTEDLQRADGPTSKRSLISGIALHDVYHAGQIQTLLRLHRAAGKADVLAEGRR